MKLDDFVYKKNRVYSNFFHHRFCNDWKCLDMPKNKAKEK